MNSIKEQDILDKSKLAISKLFENEIWIEEKFVPKNTAMVDGHLILNSIQFSYEIIAKPSKIKISEKLTSKKKQSNHIENLLIVSDYMPPKLALFLKEKNLFFIDGSGNCYINLPNMKIFVEGRKNIFVESNNTKRAFQKTGLKLIFELLKNPSLANFSYRDIAQKTKISLASVGYIFDELKEEGFVTDIANNKRNLSNLKRLVTKWANIYGEILRPKIHRGFYKSLSKENNQNNIFHSNDSENKSVFIGGEYAAHYLNGSIKPGKLVLYTNERLSEMAKNHKIVPQGKQHINNESIEILEKFWADIEPSNNDDSSLNYVNIKNLVNPILIYADLISSNSYRSLETAEAILNNEIRDRFIKYNFQW